MCLRVVTAETSMECWLVVWRVAGKIIRCDMDCHVIAPLVLAFWQ